MSNNLSKESQALLVAIYKEYKKRVDSGMTIDRATMLGSSLEIRNQLCPLQRPDDVSHWCWELHNQGFLSCLGADGMAYYVTLTDDGIDEAKNFFKNSVKDIVNEVTGILSIFKQ